MDSVERLAETLRRGGLGHVPLNSLLSTPEGPVYGFHTTGDQAVAWWRALRRAVPTTAHWPVVLGPDESLGRLRLQQEAYCDESAETLVEQALEVDVPAWLRGRRRRFTEEPGLHGEWPAAEPNHGFSIPFDGSGAALPRVHIGLMPTSAGWHSPIVLRFGGWSDCPSPAEHAGLLRAWADRYGVELVGMTGDVIELSVQRPPTTAAGALALAEEQFSYCEDVVRHGTGTMETLAARLLGGTAWFFRWH